MFFTAGSAAHEASGPGVSFRGRKLPGDGRFEVSLAEVSPSNVTGNEQFDLAPQPASICRLKALENSASERMITVIAYTTYLPMLFV